MSNCTVALDADAYQKLIQAQFPGESLSEVVRRGTFAVKSITGAGLLEYYSRQGGKVSDEYLNSAESAAQHDPIPDNPWH